MPKCAYGIYARLGVVSENERVKFLKQTTGATKNALQSIFDGVRIPVMISIQ